MSSSFPSPHSNCSRINEYFADLGWLSIQDKKTIVKRVYYGIDLVKGVISWKANFELKIIESEQELINNSAIHNPQCEDDS